ncbi:hypothetical protein ABZ027_08235 [Streptomyces sp. NPDC006332]
MTETPKAARTLRAAPGRRLIAAISPQPGDSDPDMDEALRRVRAPKAVTQ